MRSFGQQRSLYDAALRLELDSSLMQKRAEKKCQDVYFTEVLWRR